jgi:predicted AlkP superfamily phosphohydrolase/phosphomutase
VPEAEREAVIAEVITDLKALRCAESGRPVVRDVVRLDQLVRGTRARLLPDLILLWTEGRHRRLSHPRAPDISPRGGITVKSEHRGLGALFAAGPHIRRATFRGELVDVAPTVLHLMGSPIPEAMTGQVLGPALTKPGREIRVPIELDRDALA